MLLLMLVVDILALIILFFIRNKISDKKFTNIKQRIFTWFIIIILFYLGSRNRIYMLILFGLISLFYLLKNFYSLPILNMTVN